MDDRLPVIVGVGESLDRPADIARAKGPLDLIAEAIAAAETDAGATLTAGTDSIDVIKHTSVWYEDLPNLVRQRLGIGPCHAVLGEGSGNGPTRELHNAALRVQRGESKVALVCGAEAQWSVDQARKAGIRLPWQGVQDAPEVFRAPAYANSLALKYGVLIPTQVYPLYENATTAAWGQMPRQAIGESARIWSAMSRVAAAHPGAWMRRPYEPEEIAQSGPKNRLLAWPYTKLMVAQPSVNLASAIFVTTVGYARVLGIPRERLIFIEGGAAAREPDDFLLRDSYVVNASQSAVLQAMQAGRTGHEAFDLVELYSCFPVVPKMARRLLGLAEDNALTQAGGLTFFGAPVHNYMSHAAAAMTRRLRAGGQRGLLYGQGGNVTKHHALSLTSSAPASPILQDYSVQAQADAARGPVPDLLSDYTGRAIIETFTVLHDRGGRPSAGVLLLRTPFEARVLATVLPTDTPTIERLKDLDDSPVGRVMEVTRGASGMNEGRFA